MSKGIILIFVLTLMAITLALVAISHAEELKPQNQQGPKLSLDLHKYGLDLPINLHRGRAAYDLWKGDGKSHAGVEANPKRVGLFADLRW